MKISVRNAIVLSFAVLILLMFVCQTVFNLYFAQEYYTAYKYGAMEELFYDIKLVLDSNTNADYEQLSLEIATTVLEQEDEHNVDIFVWADNEAIYGSTSRNIQKDHFKPPIPDWIPMNIESRLRGTPENYSETPKVDSLDNNLLRLQGKVVDGDDEVYIMMSLPISSIESSVDIFTASGMVISAVVLLIGFFASLIISKNISKPIKEIEEVASQFERLDFRNKVSEGIAMSELNSLAGSINSMSSQLESAVADLNVANEKLKEDIDYQKRIEQMRREFVANVSHEMKTPLALLQMYAANLKSNLEGIDKDYYCETIIEETERLNSMVVSMLDISSIESGLSQMEFKHISLTDLAVAFAAKISPMFEELKLETDIRADITVNADSKYLEQAMKNYASNAADHSVEGGTVTISLVEVGEYAEFAIHNVGQGVSEEDGPNIWDSFYRGDKSHTRSGNNVGLGLHIVSAIMKEHDGEYGFRNENNGVTFYFRVKRC